jgi:hypothetical protein
MNIQFDTATLTDNDRRVLKLVADIETEPEPEPEQPKQRKKPGPKSKAEKEAEAKANESDSEAGDVQEAIDKAVELTGDGKHAVVRAALKKVDVAKVSELKPAQVGDFLAALDE